MNRHFRQRKVEQWKDDYIAFGGGIDLTSTPFKISPGRISQSTNWEEVFGIDGYRTIKGYERFSGLASPSRCNYALQSFDAGGTTAIAAGNTVTNQTSTASAVVVSVTLTSGSWAGGNAVGTLLLTSMTGAWADNDQIRVGGVQRALASAATLIGSIGIGAAANETNLRTARNYLRNLIAKPAGEGRIQGVAVFNEHVYAVRNIVGNASATLWRSSAAGWVSIATGLPPSANYRFEVANFSGSSTETSLFGVNGKGRLFRVDSADVVTFAAPIYGTEATSVTSNTVGTGAKTWTVAQASRAFANGDIVVIHDAANWANSMTGTVTSYNSGTGALNVTVTSSTGAGTFTAWEIGLADYSDKPYDLTEFKDHLFLAYPFGQLQSSNLGDPMVYTTTAALFGIGADITGLTSLKGEVLGVFARQIIRLLRGSSAIDWDMGTHTKDVGAATDTVQDNAGNAIFLDDKGITTLQATLDFGDFNSAIMSANVKAILDTYRTRLVGSRMAKNNYQYRLYFDNGVHLRGTILTGNPVLTPKDISFTTSEYLHTPTCFASGIMDDGLDRMFFGTEDGWVMEEDAGTNFDGEAIVYALRTPFNHCKSVNIDKRFHKAIFEMMCQDAVELKFRQIFDYDNGTYSHGGTWTVDVPAPGGQFDAGAWDTFSFDGAMVTQAEASINGIGSNMAMILFFDSDFVRPMTLQGLLLYFSILGIKR